MQGLPSSNFFPYKSSYHFRYLNCCQILYSNATDLKLGSFYLVFPALFISGTHNVSGLNCNGGWGLLGNPPPPQPPQCISPPNHFRQMVRYDSRIIQVKIFDLFYLVLTFTSALSESLNGVTDNWEIAAKIAPKIAYASWILLFTHPPPHATKALVKRTRNKLMQVCRNPQNLRVYTAGA